MNIRRHLILTAATATLWAASCGTGIDSTGRVTDDEVRRITSSATPAHGASDPLADLRPAPMAGWTPGKALLVTDDKLRLLLGNTAPAHDMAGDTIRFVGSSTAVSPAGEPLTVLRFSAGADTIAYRTRRIAPADIPYIPLTVDLQVVDSARAILRGHRYYLLTPDRFDLDGTHRTGRKFIPVTITDVLAGNSEYPLAVVFREEGQPERMLLLSTDARISAHRTFTHLLSADDPRTRYPAVSETVWTLIQQGRVAPGMTRAECRLSLGAPSSVDTRPSGGGFITETWIYDSGRCLVFEDGLLTRSR